MKRIILLCALLTLLTTACSREQPTGPVMETPTEAALDPQAVAAEILAQTGWEPLDPSSVPEKTMIGPPGQVISWIESVERFELGDGIVHYDLTVRTGPGAYDLIGLHRVVQENERGRPLRTHRNVFLQHGDIKDFQGMFLPGFNSPRQADDVGFAVYLAQAGFDVWGIDQAWTLVPYGVADLSFMADWGLQRQVDDLETGLAVARAVRQVTTGQPGRMLLLGYSSGSVTGFAYLAQESQIPEVHRQVAGFVSADFGMVSDNSVLMDGMCADAANYEELMAAGQYGALNPFAIFGPPALEDPDGPSPYLPGFTNLTASIAIAVAPAYEGLAYHYLAGTFDSTGFPTGFQYTNVDNWVDFMVYAPPYEPYQFQTDYSKVICAPETVPWDDHLGDVTVPLLWLSANGGVAPPVIRTLDVVGSDDITEVHVGFYPPEMAGLDFAHIDLFIADNAETEVWAPTLEWLQAKSPLVKPGLHRERQIKN